MNDNEDLDAKDDRASAAGVFGSSANGEGVHGETSSRRFVAGVVGLALHPDGVGPGVLGESRYGDGVIGKSTGGTGVLCFHGDPALGETTVSNDASRAGVFGASADGAGVLGYSRDPDSPAVYAFGTLKAIALGKPFAGQFIGDVQVDGDIFVSGADCAERFEAAVPDISSGSVVVIDDEGRLQECDLEYDCRVAGIVAGAGGYRSAIVLDNHRPRAKSVAIALLGKVYCKVDAGYSPIRPGDLLTTSSTSGHAMKLMDAQRGFGAVIGKALGSLSSGVGLVPVLAALR
jgi:hypothetical protein